MSGKLNKSKSTKKITVKTNTSVKNAVKRKKFMSNNPNFLDVLNEDVWEYMNDFHESELK